MQTIKDTISDLFKKAENIELFGDQQSANRHVFKNIVLVVALSAGTMNGAHANNFFGQDNYNQGAHQNSNYQDQNYQSYQTSPQDMMAARQAYQQYYQFALSNEARDPSSATNSAREAIKTMDQQRLHATTQQAAEKALAGSASLSNIAPRLNEITAQIFAAKKLNDAARAMHHDNNFVHPILDATNDNAMPLNPYTYQFLNQALGSGGSAANDAQRLDGAKRFVANVVVPAAVKDEMITLVQQNPGQFQTLLQHNNQYNQYRPQFAPTGYNIRSNIGGNNIINQNVRGLNALEGQAERLGHFLGM